LCERPSLRGSALALPPSDRHRRHRRLRDLDAGAQGGRATCVRRGHGGTRGLARRRHLRATTEGPSHEQGPARRLLPRGTPPTVAWGALLRSGPLAQGAAPARPRLPVHGAGGQRLAGSLERGLVAGLGPPTRLLRSRPRRMGRAETSVGTGATTVGPLLLLP